MPHLRLLGRLALLALFVAGLAAPSGATLVDPHLSLSSLEALDPGPLAGSARFAPEPTQELPPAPHLVGILIPLDELGMTPALELAKPPPSVIVGLCRRDDDDSPRWS